MYKYIVFDFDGTLVNTNDLIDKTIRATARYILNREVDQALIDSIWGKALTEQMSDLDATRVDELCQFYSSYYRRYRDDHTLIFDGIIQMLEQLHQMGCDMGIVTNKGESGLEHGLDMFDMKDYFKIALSKTDVLMKKPHPEGLYKVMKYFKAKPGDVLFIGDSIHDIECGRNAGVDTVLVKWTVMDIEAFRNEAPTYIAETPEDIIHIVKKGSNH